MEQHTALGLFIVVSVLTLLSCVIAIPYGYRYWKIRSLCLKDFERLSTEAKELNGKTLEIKNDVDQDNTAAECIKMTNQELLGTAEEWDDGIRTALTAWGDFVQMQQEEKPQYPIDLEKQPRMGADDLAKQRKNHARFMIKFMRAKVIEGIEQRKEISVQLLRIHLAVKSRSSKWQASQANRRLDDGREIIHEKGNKSEDDESSVTSSTTSSPCRESPSLNSIIIALDPIDAMFERPPSRMVASEQEGRGQSVCAREI
ncbi:hypothetical protein BJ875DRAFT_524464 [Amylocarpus encephaloides]|uniref:Uncharacterized protein n=1 Tax=Amylocarpus encephaloides TaxID=45428 RepID=A0A9P7YP48_9HELO|nr:hypothetical protein BJ875DRAFT_524464 [Amylocarpus encephaloides]